MDFNKVIILGRLTRDPEVKYSSSGTAICSWGMAINRRYNGSDGERREEVCFVDLKAFGRQAEIVGEYVTKGNPLLVEGRLSFYSWEDEEGKKRNKLSVIAERVQLMGKRRDDEDAPPDEMKPVAEDEKADNQPQDSKAESSNKQHDDIPF